MVKEILKYASNIVIGLCIGSFVDFAVGTRFICSAVGVVLGIVVTILLKKSGH